MSAFLGPIHYWLFNKIQTIESRAFAIADALKTAGKDKAVDEIVEDYGDRLEGQDLDVLIGDNPIHQFLAGLIAKAQVLESRIVEAAGDDVETALKAAEEHGKKTAARAVENKPKPEDFEGIWQYINDYQLEGMPCDPGADVSLGSNGSMRYAHTVCNHMQNWQYTGVDMGRMCQVTNAWLKGFVSGLNGDVEYNVERSIVGGADKCEAVLKLKG